ncbi:hypothetical protein [Thiobacillus denitrificans]|uniref:Uncharacterized protein n=1 Tax=Thiobacillus denitrificans TaxID=36861 RepID=A0A119CWK5_THIDE|nr:hypothetical protein [Thiobacillus denitrificans]KVW96779.1 hypothetical protein ABW22_07500 [Thiobacillus denitrificans]
MTASHPQLDSRADINAQAFARNLVWSPEHGLGAIDFEDDPISAMPLAQAQIRDWRAKVST